MLHHSVIFTLKYPENTPEANAFFKAASELAILPGVENFEILRQTSPQNSFQFGITMTFQNKQHYKEYSDHSTHKYFIEQYWKKSVGEFLEIDYEPFYEL